MPKSGLRSSKGWTDALKTTILAFSADPREPGSECQYSPPWGGQRGGFWPHWARTPHVQRRAGGIRLGMSRLDRFRAPQTQSFRDDVFLSPIQFWLFLAKNWCPEIRTSKLHRSSFESCPIQFWWFIQNWIGEVSKTGSVKF